MGIGRGADGSGAVNTGDYGLWNNVPNGKRVVYCKFSVNSGIRDGNGLFSFDIGTGRSMVCRVMRGTPYKLRFHMNASQAIYFDANIGSYGTVYDVAVLFDQSDNTFTPKVAVNGALVSLTYVGTPSNVTSNTDLDLFYWRGGDGLNGFSGIVYDFAVYLKELTSRQLTSLTQGFTDPLVFQPDFQLRLVSQVTYRSLFQRDAGGGSNSLTNTYTKRHKQINYLS